MASRSQRALGRFDNHFRVCLPQELADFVQSESADEDSTSSAWLRRLVAREYSKSMRERATEATLAELFGD